MRQNYRIVLLGVSTWMFYHLRGSALLEFHLPIWCEHKYWDSWLTGLSKWLSRDAAGFIVQHLRCETRAHCLTVCVLPPAVFYFRYAFIYAVWNAVLLDVRNSRTDRLSHVLCVVVLKLAAEVKCTCIFEYFYTKLMYTQSVMFSEQDKASDIEIDLCISVNADC